MLELDQCLQDFACAALVAPVRQPSELTDTLLLQAIQEIYQLLSQQDCWWCQHYDCEWIKSPLCLQALCRCVGIHTV